MPPNKVFNRIDATKEPFCQILQQIWNDADEKLRASLVNIALDHRVSDELIRAFLPFVSPPDDHATRDEVMGALGGWVDSYKATCSAVTGYPAFLATANQNNRLDQFERIDDTGPRPPKLLVTIIKSRYFASQFPGELKKRFPNRPDPQYLDARSQYAMHDEDEAKFREAFCAAWAEKIACKPQHPKWAADLEEFNEHRYTERESCDWEMLFGKEPGVQPYIVALCGYPLNEAGEVYRPTIIDADANHLHYPSPPWIEIARGGLTVALGSCRRCPSLAEFIHHDLAYKPEHFLAFKLHYPRNHVIDWQEDRLHHSKKLLARYPAHQQEFTDWQNYGD